MSRRQRVHGALTVAAGLAIVLVACAKGPPQPSGTQEHASAAPAVASAPPVVAPPLVSQANASRATGPTGDLAACPPRNAILRVGGVFANEAFSPHPMEGKVSSIHYTRLFNLPLFGADPQETKLDPEYGAASAWEFSNNATTLRVRLHEGLTFNNGDPVTAEDVVFSLELAASEFSDFQLTGIMRAFGATAEAQSDRELLSPA